MDDDDDGDDGDDDDDDVERTRTGPSAVHSDLEHQVNHNAKISHFYHNFSSYEEGGPTGACKTRCLAVLLLPICEETPWGYLGKRSPKSADVPAIFGDVLG